MTARHLRGGPSLAREDEHGQNARADESDGEQERGCVASELDDVGQPEDHQHDDDHANDSDAAASRVHLDLPSYDLCGHSIVARPHSEPMLPADEALPAWGPRCGQTRGSGRLAPEDPHGPDHDQLEKRPADEGEDGRDIEHRTTRREVILVEDAVERRDEDLADIEDARDERVAGAGVEQEQDDARPDDDLDQPEQEDDDPPGQLGGPGARPRDVTTVRPHRLLARGRRGLLGDDRPVDFIHGPTSSFATQPDWIPLPESPLKGAPAWPTRV